MTDSEVDGWARTLGEARMQRGETEPPTATIDLTVADAYRVQRALVAEQVTAGERVIGAKLGLTSKAKQTQMGVDEPIFGVLTDSMQISSGGTFDLSRLIHPRCEPEIVFVMSDELAGARLTPDDVLDATATVHGGIEIIDSRYRAFSFTLPDVIADNTSAARFVVGEVGAAPRDFDLTVLGCTFMQNSDITGTATGAALLGDPAACVALLVSHLADRGDVLPAGSVVLAGSLTDAIRASVGDRFTARFSGLGEATVGVA